MRRVAVSCAIGAAALLSAGCSCDGLDEPWREAAYVSTAEAAVAKGSAPLPEPACEVEAEAAVKASSGAAVDPDLVEIARLEIERDCYREAARVLRERLKAQESGTRSK